MECSNSTFKRYCVARIPDRRKSVGKKNQSPALSAFCYLAEGVFVKCWKGALPV